MPALLTDSHTHLDAEAFDADRESVIERARSAGIGTILTVGAGSGLASARRAIALSEKYSFVFASVGIHPCDARAQEPEQELEHLAHHPRVVAIGETGLDYYWDKSFIPEQERWFRFQIQLARRVRKPLIIHSRAAGLESLRILEQEKAVDVGGVFHCFAEDEHFAAKLREINFLVSFPGVLTFKKADETRRIAAAIPLDQIMLETDAPYLAPEPFRGKRCETGHVLETARVFAKLRGLSLDEVAAATSANASRLFNFPINGAAS